MNWTGAVAHLRAHRRPGVLVTVTAVRGHAPREAGAKMVVAGDGCWGTIGGGNLEETALHRAREMLTRHARAPETIGLALNDKVPMEYGRQCCGGEVSVLLEPLAVVPSVAIFGMGHVGQELSRILARHDLELHLVDSRAGQLDPRVLPSFQDAVATVHVHHAPVPELVLGEVPPGTHVLIMTHDHAEDAALVDSALRCAHLGSIGLIGSSAKWRRFQVRLGAEGHSAADLARVITPIGIPQVTGKQPAVIAVSVAADLLQRFDREAQRAETHAMPESAVSAERQANLAARGENAR